MPRRVAAFIVFALSISVGCIQLGRWQLTRLDERRASNRVIATRLGAPPATLADALRDTLTARYRRVALTGRWDYEHEFVLASRSRSGSPGVYLVTPLIAPSALASMGDSAVLVLRGWVYSPDGATIDRAQWRRPADSAGAATVDIRGFVEEFSPGVGAIASPRGERVIRYTSRDSLSRLLPYAIAPRLVVQTSDSAERADQPARLTPPTLSDGPHRSYAIQWFSFAAIAWIGVAAVVRRERATHAVAADGEGTG